MPTTLETGRDSAYVGISVRIRGEIQGKEDLFLDGEIEGDIRLPGQRLVVGPNARIHGQIQAREVLVQGKVQGNIRAQSRLEIQRTGWVEGELKISRIAIEDGAYFKGSVEIAAEESATDSASAAQAAAAPSGSAMPSSAAGVAAQPLPQTPPIQRSWLKS